MLIGKKIKELREARKMSLTEVSQQSGVQLATLSRMENLKMTGTLESHIKIAQALGVSLPQLYSDLIKEGKKVDLQTAKSSNDVFVHSKKSSYEILTAKVLSKKMMPILLKIEPAGETHAEQNPPGTEKFIFILEGKIAATIAGETYALSRSNTLYFDASLEHKLVNTGKRAARVICVATPVVL